MDPISFYIGDDKNDRLFHMISGIGTGGPPVDIYQDGVRVAVIISPEEFDLLYRLTNTQES